MFISQLKYSFFEKFAVYSGMKLFTILLTGLMLFSALYAPQPVYPVLISEFGVMPTDIALLQTATFVPLTLSPILYGVMVDRFSPAKVMRFALFFLAAGEILFALSNSFYTLLASRFFQGLFIPAGMTAVVSYISTSYQKGEIQRYISYYMAATMAGGVAGRILAGFFSTVFNWRLSFILLGISVFSCFILSLFLPDTYKRASGEKHGILQMLSNKEYIKPVAVVFFAFIVFSSIMNFFSIRLKELSPDMNGFLIGAAYIGSLFGSVTAYLTPYFAKITGSYKKTALTAFITMLLALYLFTLPNVPASIATLFLFCGSFIVIHTSCSGLLNKYADVDKGALNGVYFTVYYMGGVIGSFLPGYIYDFYGWNIFLIMLSLSALTGLTITFFSRIENESTQAEL